MNFDAYAAFQELTLIIALLVAIEEMDSLIFRPPLFARVLFFKKGFKWADQLFKVSFIQTLLNPAVFHVHPCITPPGIAELVYQSLMHDQLLYTG